jgi:hypothetical protein
MKGNKTWGEFFTEMINETRPFKGKKDFEELRTKEFGKNLFSL